MKNQKSLLGFFSKETTREKAEIQFFKPVYKGHWSEREQESFKYRIKFYTLLSNGENETAFYGQWFFYIQVPYGEM
jgi:hypothetical protein